MNCKKTLLALLALFLFCGIAFAEDTVAASTGNTGNSVQSQIKMPNSVDFGMPQQSFASPEYVAQERMLESMTTAYNWITLNSSRFAKGCTEDKPALITEITTVLSKAQETSTVCNTFASEAKSCNPQSFCAKFKQGNLPLPANTISTLKKLGFDPTTLKVEDITTDLITKVCVEQRNASNSEMTSMLESVKQKIQDQLSGFREKCELLKQTRIHVPDIMLPNIDIRPQAQQKYVVQSQSQMPAGGGACAEPHPDCYPLPAPRCNNGKWVCEGIAQQQMQQPVQQQTDASGNIVCQGQAPNCDGSPPPMCQNGNWVCPPKQPSPQPQEPQPQPVVEQPPVEPAPEPAPAPAPEPAPAPAPEPSAPTGAVTMGTSVCGNSLCEPDFGEDISNCPQDCTPNSGIPEETYNPTPETPMPYNQNPNQQTQTMQPTVNNFVMPGPEQLCQMSDDEIISVYTNQMSGGTPGIEEIQSECSQQAPRELSNMSRYKLEVARCEADAALDCEAKKQALSACSEMKSSPEKVSGIIVDSMCRKFGVNGSNSANEALYTIATKWADSDPALANQLGATADQVTQAKESLDVMSYVFGNGNYADNLSQKAAELRTVRQKLATSGVNDQETLSTLDSQAKQLENESNQFKNLLDFGRLMQMFK